MRFASALVVLLVACHAATDPVPAPATTASADPGTPAAPAVPSSALVVPSSAPAARPGRVSYPPLADSCRRDGECALVPALPSDARGPGCCVQCDVYTAGTTAWAADARAACTAAGPCTLPSSCVAPAVPTVKATCQAGRCVVTNK